MELRFGWPLQKVGATGSYRSRVRSGSQEASHNRRSATPRMFASRPRFRLWHTFRTSHGVGDESAKWGKADIGALLAIRGSGARALQHEPAPSSGRWRARAVNEMRDLGLQPRPNSNCFEGSAAQNSKFVKYGAGGRSSVPVENGFGTASELSTRNECSRPSAAFPRLERLGCPARRSSGARY